MRNVAQTFYLMRHGETLFNQLNKIQGWCDSPLTERGIAQAKIAGTYFEQNNITLNAAYSSTSERCVDTLELVTDYQLDYTRLKVLKEWNFGRFEGEQEFLNPKLPYGNFFVPYGGEPELEFQKRIADTMLEIAHNEPDDQNILVVSHGAACVRFMHYWEHTSDVEIESLRNCSIAKLTFSHEAFHLDEIIHHDSH